MIETIEKEAELKWKQLHAWYLSDVGQAVYQQESKYLSSLIESCFGLYLLQFSCYPGKSLPDASRIKKKCILNCYSDVLGSQFVSSFESLAIKERSIDTVILFHCLELSSDPHLLLREVDRILVSQGKLIIVAFNPWSFLGLKKLLTKGFTFFKKEHHGLPCESHFYSMYRLHDWLSLLGFGIEHQQRLFYRLPLNNKICLNENNLFEKMLQKTLPQIGSSQIIVANKRLSTMTPISHKWQIKRKSPLIVTEPSTCDSHD